jgi:hypothetical protein
MGRNQEVVLAGWLEWDVGCGMWEFVSAFYHFVAVFIRYLSLRCVQFGVNWG